MKNKGTAQTVFSVTAITLLVRLMSLVSIQLYNGVYGLDQLNEYNFALVTTNTIFTCIGTLLTTIIVPTYSALLAKKEMERAKKFLDNILSIFVLFITVLIILCYLVISVIYDAEMMEEMALVVFYLKVFFPLMLFNGLSFIFQGILQSHGKFKLPAAVAIPSSLTIILYIAVLGEKYGVTGLVFATFMGLALQAVILIPAVMKTGYRYSLSLNFKSPEIVTCGKLALPVLIAVSAYQINIIFNTAMAFRIDQNAILGQVNNLVIVSILTFVYSITAVYYPMFSVLWAKEDHQGYKDRLCEVMDVMMFFLIPASFGFILVRFQIFELLKFGKITSANVITQGNILGLYALGILALGFKEIMDRAFYAQNNTKVSAVMGFVIMGCNVVFCLLFIDRMGIYAMPLSYSISSTLGVAGLTAVMNKKIGGLHKNILVTAGKCSVAAILMSVVIYFEIKILSNYFGGSVIAKAVKLLIPVGTGVIVYFAAAYLLKVNQVRTVMDKIKHGGIK